MQRNVQLNLSLIQWAIADVKNATACSDIHPAVYFVESCFFGASLRQRGLKRRMW
jgi:hypothetical protein